MRCCRAGQGRRRLAPRAGTAGRGTPRSGATVLPRPRHRLRNSNATSSETSGRSTPSAAVGRAIPRRGAGSGRPRRRARPGDRVASGCWRMAPRSPRRRKAKRSRATSGRRCLRHRQVERPAARQQADHRHAVAVGARFQHATPDHAREVVVELRCFSAGQCRQARPRQHRLSAQAARRAGRHRRATGWRHCLRR